MARDRHHKLAAAGSDAWNAWRKGNSGIAPDLSNALLPDATLGGADLSFTNLFAADLSGADLGGADFNSANLMYADLSGADLSGADFRQANLFAADLSRTRLKGSRFSGAHASGIKLREADLEGANLFVADISRADLSDAVLRRSNFFGSMLNHSDLSGADCREADLSGADLAGATLAGLDLTGATLSDCKIKGVQARDLELQGAIQNDILLTAEGEPEITVDGFAAALYLLTVIDDMAPSASGTLPGNKPVLLLGAYPHERKAFLNAIREEMRAADCVPLAFDLETAGDADYSPLVKNLVHFSCLVLVDLGGIDMLPPELGELAATTNVPVQPFLAGPASSGMTSNIRELIDSSFLKSLFQTDDTASMIMALRLRVIEPIRNEIPPNE